MSKKKKKQKKQQQAQGQINSNLIKLYKTQLNEQPKSPIAKIDPDKETLRELVKLQYDYQKAINSGLDCISKNDITGAQLAEAQAREARNQSRKIEHILAIEPALMRKLGLQITNLINEQQTIIREQERKIVLKMQVVQRKISRIQQEFNIKIWTEPNTPPRQRLAGDISSALESLCQLTPIEQETVPDDYKNFLDALQSEQEYRDEDETRYQSLQIIELSRKNTEMALSKLRQLDPKTKILNFTALTDQIEANKAVAKTYQEKVFAEQADELMLDLNPLPNDDLKPKQALYNLKKAQEENPELLAKAIEQSEFDSNEDLREHLVTLCGDATKIWEGYQELDYLKKIAKTENTDAFIQTIIEVAERKSIFRIVNRLPVTYRLKQLGFDFHLVLRLTIEKLHDSSCPQCIENTRLMLNMLGGGLAKTDWFYNVPNDINHKEYDARILSLAETDSDPRVLYVKLEDLQEASTTTCEPGTHDPKPAPWLPETTKSE